LLNYYPDIYNFYFNTEKSNEQAIAIVTTTKGSTYTMIAGALVLMFSN
jgi:hypothetical protein